MEFHIPCDPQQISRYVFCPGSHRRASRIAEKLENTVTVVENRGYNVYSGTHEGIFMTVCGTGMGGPAVGIALEELAHMGADTFIRVGSCGVYQHYQKPGDVIVATGTVREGGTGFAYLPPNFPAVPSYPVLSALVHSAERLGTPVTIGLGVTKDAFYGPQVPEMKTLYQKAGLVFVEMECDTLFILGQYHGWRTGAILTADSPTDEIKPAWGKDDFARGENQAIAIALAGMKKLAICDTAQ